MSSATLPPAGSGADPEPAGRCGSRRLPRPWPLIERAGLLERIESALAGGGSVLVVGPTGIGRTALLTRLGARRPAAPQLVGAALADPPGVRDLTDLPDLPDLRDLPGVHLVLGDLGPPLALVDDAHRLPAASATALADLAATGRIQLVAAIDPAAAAARPWARWWREGPAERVDIEPFTLDEAAETLTGALAAPVSSITVHQLWAASAGVPFYLRELVAGMVAAGTLVKRSGCWVETGPPLPGPRLRDVARHELSRLDDESRTAVELLALVAPLPVGRLVDVVGEEVLERLRCAGLVTVDRGATTHERGVLDARISPPVLADAVRDAVPAGRRRRLLARLELARPPAAGPEGTLRTLESALECGLPSPAEHLLAAMGTALAHERPDLALRLGEAAVEAAGDRGDLAAAARLLRAGAWRLLDRPDRTAHELSLVPHLLAGPMPAAARRTLSLRLVEAEESLLFHAGDTDGALAALDRFRADVAGDQATSAFVGLARLERLGRAGRHAEALPGSLAVLGGPSIPVRAARLVPAVVLGLAEHGRFEEALDLLRRHGTGAESRTDTPWLATEVCAAGILAHVWSGDVEGAREYVRGDGVPRAGHRDASGDLGAALLASARGMWTQADRAWSCAAARLEGADPAGSLAFVLAGQAMAAAALGESARAAGLALRGEGVPLRAAGAARTQVRLFGLDAAIWARSPQCSARAAALAAWARREGLPRAELEALHRHAFVVHADGAHPGAALLERMRELVSGMDAVPRTAALLAHAEAMAAADHPFVAVTARELSRVGVWLPAAATGAGLTRREQEIAGLAASGLSSKEIGARLTLSVRTVDSHLSRVFTKLGVRSRVELGAVIPSSAAAVTAGRRTS